MVAPRCCTVTTSNERPSIFSFHPATQRRLVPGPTAEVRRPHRTTIDGRVPSSLMRPTVGRCDAPTEVEGGDQRHPVTGVGLAGRLAGSDGPVGA